MLYISRWKAAAILVTVITVSAMAIPNLLSERTFQSLPRWAQHRIVPGIEFQGGSRLVLEVDVDAIRKQKVEQLRDEARKALREAKVGLVQAALIRGESVEVRIRESELGRGLAALHAQFASLPSYVTIESVGGGLVRLAVTEDAIRDRIQPGRQASINIIRRRIGQLGVVFGGSVESRGTDLVEIVLPGLVEPSRLFAVMH